jgi:hypothetical protein
MLRGLETIFVLAGDLAACMQGEKRRKRDGNLEK